MIARVLGPIAAASFSTLTLAVSRSTSTKIGVQPFCTMGATVVGNPAATVTTSLPGAIRRSCSFQEVRAVNASRLAADPDTVSRQCCKPKRAASAASNSVA